MNKARILVVEDEAVVAQDIQHTLTGLGYTVVAVANSGPEAIALSAQTKPDLVLMDVVLRGEMDGIEAARQVRRRFGIPVVYLSAYADDDTLQRARSAEPLGYLIKPFDSRELRTCIEMALYRHGYESTLADREEALRRQSQNLVLLNQISWALTSTLELQQVIVRLLQAAVQVVGAEGSSVWLWDQQEEGSLICQALYHGHDCLSLDAVRLRTGEGVAGWVAQTGQCAIVPDAEQDARFYPGVDQQTGLHTRSLLAVPLRMRDQNLGVLEVVNKLEGVFSDQDRVVMETVAASAAIAIDNARLFEETERLKMFAENIVQSVAETLLIVDSRGIFTFVNSAAQELLGYRREELLGSHWSLIIPSVRRSDMELEWSRWSQGKGGRYDTVLQSKDGRVIPALASIRPLLADGRFDGVLAAFTDITDRVHAAEEQARLISELDAFAHTVAHDLKAPLTLVIGYADVLLHDSVPLSAEEKKQYLQALMRGSVKMGSIVDELLLLASVRRREDVEVKPLDMRPIISEVMHRLAYMIEEHDAVVRMPDQWPRVLGYGPWVEEVWINYLSNAIKYGGRPPEVIVGSEPTETSARRRMVRLWVQDNGPGLSAEEQARLFRPFARLDQVRVLGHGLGLSIARRIVERLEGEVRVESRIGQGSRFSFTLPSADDARGAAASL